MKRLLKLTCLTVSKRKSKKLSARQYARLQANYRNILTRGSKELPELPAKEQGRRGRIAKSDAANLHERLLAYEDAVLKFARIDYVPFTNNRAERDIRMEKVKKKISGCFRSEETAKAYYRISSYLKTMTYEGVNPIVAIQWALSGKIPGWT